tara:strand:+ start:484 stop:768 length:285 start_codon:yes stop_codon:yes gene_type:complete
MFIIELTYKKPLDDVEKYIVAHRQFLDKFYNSNNFIASGPQVPRTGGIILAKAKSKVEVQDIIEQDPFYINSVAEYRIIEFDPIKRQSWFNTEM